jgi:hypothetical protein
LVKRIGVSLIELSRKLTHFGAENILVCPLALNSIGKAQLDFLLSRMVYYAVLGYAVYTGAL